MEPRYYDDGFDYPTYWKLFDEIDRVEDELKDCQVCYFCVHAHIGNCGLSLNSLSQLFWHS